MIKLRKFLEDPKNEIPFEDIVILEEYAKRIEKNWSLSPCLVYKSIIEKGLITSLGRVYMVDKDYHYLF